MSTNSCESKTCKNCKFLFTDCAGIEQLIPGLSSLGSAFGNTIGCSRLCIRHDQLTSFNDRCLDFQLKSNSI